MKKTTFLLLLNFSIFSSDHPYIIIQEDLLNTNEKEFSFIENEKSTENTNLFLKKVNKKSRSNLSSIAHQYHRCGGYFAFTSEKEAQQFLKSSKQNNTKRIIFSDYSINQEELVLNALKEVDEFSLRSIILKLSSFHNRYYLSKTGIESQEWLKKHWEEITEHRNDVNISFFQHKDFPQPSLIATIQGESDEIIIIGGHGDSISGWWGNKKKKKAPGADDNASGIAVLTEALRILSTISYKPKKTLMFMSYAAEEVGLLGSKEISSQFKKLNKNIIGVLQLDMTNYNKKENEIALISDYTNSAQNNFLASLLDKYQPEVIWSKDRCGYACSDHASWTSQGFPASFPFESKAKKRNPYIHSKKDTLDKSNDSAYHAVNFLRLALSYIIELDQ